MRQSTPPLLHKYLQTDVTMISAAPAPVDTDYIPEAVARQVLTIGYEHRPYKGGIGYLISVYERYFSVFKYITTYRMFPNKALLIGYFAGQYLRLLRTLMTDRSIRIVHIHGASYGSFYRKFVVFLTARYLFGRRTIYHMNGSEFEVFYTKSPAPIKSLIRFMVEKTDVMLCLSESWRAFFTANFTMQRIEVLGNVIDVPPVPTHPKASASSSAPLNVLFLGLIGNRKGIFDLLDVIRQHRADWQGRLELTIGGNGDTARLEAFIQEHDLGSLVRFAGWVSGGAKQQLLTDSDVFILPSYNEGLPLAILEALSYGLPVISTPVGGTAEVVIDGLNGFLVTPGDKGAIYDRLNRLIDAPLLVRQMGLASARLAEPYMPDAIFPKLLAIYTDLLAKK